MKASSDMARSSINSGSTRTVWLRLLGRWSRASKLNRGSLSTCWLGRCRAAHPTPAPNCRTPQRATSSPHRRPLRPTVGLLNGPRAARIVALLRSLAMTVSRLQPYATTIFAEMSALAARIGAVNLGQGFPDEDGPATMLKAAQDAIAEGVNQYPPGIGIAPLREAIADQRKRHFGIDYDPDTEVLVTVGADRK